MFGETIWLAAHTARTQHYSQDSHSRKWVIARTTIEGHHPDQQGMLVSGWGGKYIGAAAVNMEGNRLVGEHLVWKGSFDNPTCLYLLTQ